MDLLSLAENNKKWNYRNITRVLYNISDVRKKQCNCIDHQQMLMRRKAIQNVVLEIFGMFC